MSKINTEMAELIQGLSMAVLKKDAKDLTQDEATLLIRLDMDSIPIEININVTDTRKTEVQYCTNTYNAGIKISLQNIKTDLIEKITNTDKSPVEKLKEYLADKDTLIKFIRFKYDSMENFLKDLLRESEKKDKIVPVGRYAS